MATKKPYTDVGPTKTKDGIKGPRSYLDAMGILLDCEMKGQTAILPGERVPAAKGARVLARMRDFNSYLQEHRPELDAGMGKWLVACRELLDTAESSDVDNAIYNAFFLGYTAGAPFREVLYDKGVGRSRA